MTDNLFIFEFPCGASPRPLCLARCRSHSARYKPLGASFSAETFTSTCSHVAKTSFAKLSLQPRLKKVQKQGCSRCGSPSLLAYPLASPPATTHTSTGHLHTLTLPAIKLLFFVLNNSTISMVKISFGVGVGVGDHFVLYEFEGSDQSHKCKLTWQS